MPASEFSRRICTGLGSWRARVRTNIQAGLRGGQRVGSVMGQFEAIDRSFRRADFAGKFGRQPCHFDLIWPPTPAQRRMCKILFEVHRMIGKLCVAAAWSYAFGEFRRCRVGAPLEDVPESKSGLRASRHSLTSRDTHRRTERSNFIRTHQVIAGQCWRR